MLTSKILTNRFGSFKFSVDGDKRWVEYSPNIVLHDDSDADDIAEITHKAYSFLCKDLGLDDLD